MTAPDPRHLVVVLLSALALLVGCSGGGDSSAPNSTHPPTTLRKLQRPYAIGETSRTFVDSSRPTAGGEGRPEEPRRTLETTILYPAAGAPTGSPSKNATPATEGAPFPLVVLGHGLGGNVGYLTPLAQRWAAAGYVVAMPLFPLTHTGTPGGIDGADVQNQPRDMSFVIDEMLAADKGTESPLAGLIDGKKIGVSGHSNGGITTLGIVANSCCRDDRIDAALVLSGTPAPFADGTYDFEDLPPILFVHGAADEMVDYNQTAETFNSASTPKALLTLGEAGHADWMVPTNEAFDVTAKATVDFLDAYLRGDPTAIDRLASDQSPPVATMQFAPDKGSAVTASTIPAPETNRQASVSADTDLRDGQVVTVTWSGFLPGKTVNVLQCVGDGRGGTASCGIAEGHVLVADPTGAGSIDLTIRSGAFANGVCDAQHACTILVNDSGLLDEDAFRRFPITFGG